MQAIENHKVSKPLALTSRQRDVLEALKDQETPEYPISKWYLGALYALDNPHNPDRFAQAAHSLRELIEKLPRVVLGIDVQGGRSGFQDMRRSIYERILKDKKRYPKGWNGEKIDGHLGKTLRKVEKYVERNQQPTRKEQIQRAVTTIDPMVSQFGNEIQENKRDRLHDLWEKLEDFAHHKKPDVEEFGKCLEELEKTVLDLLAPITAQDQGEIQAILRRSDRSESDVERMFSLIERRGANFVFFFKHAAETADVSWLPLLKERDYFASPPSVKPVGNGGVSFPFWWPVHYLAKMFDHAPDEVIELVLQFPKVDNPVVYNEMLEIALLLHGERSVRLKPKILEYAGIEHQFLARRYADLLAHWTAEHQTSAALELSKVLVQFAPDPQSEAKQKRQRENPADWGTLWETSLEPSPRIGPSEYSEIMSKGVRPLAEREPYQVARLLIDATANMIRLRTHQEDLDKEEDYSESWCKRLTRSKNDSVDPKQTLVHTLTFACEQVYEKSPDSVVALDDALRNQQWWVFKRLRQHLYAQYPNEATKPWIRELILAHEDYDQWEHRYEFQQMIRSACEHLGAALLTKAERTRIFDAIRRGPSKEKYRGWIELLEEEFTEEDFQKRQHRFHRRQFRPFKSVLFGEYATYFQELEVATNARITDEDYPPFKTETTNPLMSKRSPRSPEDLASLTDEELLTYINKWENEKFLYEDNEFVDIDIEGLSEAFQTVVKESIIPNANRLKFWMENHEKIKRSSYVRAMINVMQEQVTAQNFDNLNEWLSFGNRVLSHTDCQHENGDRQESESEENRERDNSRRAVGDFIGVCLEEKVDVPVSAREQLAKVLEMLCTQFDWRLDGDLNRDDPIAEGINNTRSRALEDLVKFGLWLRQRELASEVSKVTTILEKRFASETEYPLTPPEYAILGKNYNRICSINEAWAIEHKSDFFPQKKLPEWLVAFESFMGYNPPFERTFVILRDDFDFALQHLADFKERDRPEGELIAILGQRLFSYYLGEMYPLRGEESLLERYYQGTNNDREQWADLFNNVGHYLWNSEHLDKSLEDRIIAFFDWRFEVKEVTELRQFNFWLQAECLEPEWRLDACSKVLDACKAESVSITIWLKTLCELLPEHTARVVECFAKLTDGIGDEDIYIYTERAKTILRAGLESGDEGVRQNAVRARENLFREGGFDLLDLDD